MSFIRYPYRHCFYFSGRSEGGVALRPLRSRQHVRTFKAIRHTTGSLLEECFEMNRQQVHILGQIRNLTKTQNSQGDSCLQPTQSKAVRKRPASPSSPLLAPTPGRSVTSAVEKSATKRSVGWISNQVSHRNHKKKPFPRLWVINYFPAGPSNRRTYSFMS